MSVCNLLEERVERIDVVGDTVTLNLSPFEIVSLRVRFAPAGAG